MYLIFGSRMETSIAKLNYTNIGLMLLSLVLAFIFPFELFLFSYAVLGPLHYLTEIQWLKDRDFFTREKNDSVVLIVLGAVFFIGFMLHKIMPENPWLYYLPNQIVLLSAGMAISMFMFSSTVKRIISAVILGVACYFLPYTGWMYAFVGLIPTFFHVAVFTGIFILIGAFRNRDISGWASVLVYTGCFIACVTIPLLSREYTFSRYVWDNFHDSGFANVSLAIVHLINPDFTIQQLLYSDEMIMLQRVLAFGYTYHFLNWFSKTEIIKWHNIPRNTLYGIIAVWIVSVIIYAISFKMGLVLLAFMSIVHVFLEFPLNIRSFKELGGHLGLLPKK